LYLIVRGCRSAETISNREPEPAPDETITRKLIFACPKNHPRRGSPVCPMVIPLPQF
jgi:hypothetical protein